jgi:hypothetical protein
MTKVTWVGEGDSDPKEIGWGGYTFKKGEAVEVENEAILEKARGNKHFKVAESKTGDASDDGKDSLSASAPEAVRTPLEAAKPPLTPPPKFPKI